MGLHPHRTTLGLVKSESVERLSLRVRGTVQGVGFRPHVYRLAQELELGGVVGNDGQGVFLEVEGERENLELFCRRLVESPPPTALIEGLSRRRLAATGSRSFQIVESREGSSFSSRVPPDLDCCRACLSELSDPANRRYQYPFIACTDCGPRYTIINQLPYDRASTSMSLFEMCESCQFEYENPADRRYHGQANCCSRCGPRLELELEEVRQTLLRGEIVALKGVGAYHLACDARSEEAVERLRRGKKRLAKPFAVMVANLEVARQLALLDQCEAELLQDRAKPIVLLRSRGELPAAIAPGLSSVGLLLPYTPLHHLLLSQPGLEALVMTSANQSGLPPASTREEAQQQLTPLADRILHHDRSIEVPSDDSVLSVFRGAPVFLRRARGYAPLTLKLPFSTSPTLALGGQMKTTVCLARESEAIMSQHLGDLDNLETLHFFEQVVDHMLKLYNFQPERVCLDLHPSSLARKWVEHRGLSAVSVQHHHVHLASCLADNGLGRESQALGIILDGTGYGSDGTIWGGELLRGGYSKFERIAWLKTVPLPGGDQAVREPWRMALSHLWAAGIPWHPSLPPVKHILPREKRLDSLRIQLEKGINTVPTSSMGRLFDAVASLVGLKQVAEYEAQAAMLLESVADPAAAGCYRFGTDFDSAPVLEEIVSDLGRDVPVGTISMRFHRAVATAVTALAAEHHQGLPIALSGGVFQNSLLLGLVIDGLEEEGLSALWHRQLPPNDGGLALGQVCVAASQ